MNERVNGWMVGWMDACLIYRVLLLFVRPVRKADNLTTILCRCHEIWEP
jgi:hypothetical protein